MEKTEDDNVKLTDIFDSSHSNNWLWNFFCSDVIEPLRCNLNVF